MHKNDLAKIEKFILEHKIDLKQNKIIPLYEDIYEVDKSGHTCAILTAFFEEKGIDPFMYLQDALPSGIYAASFTHISPQILQGDILTFEHTKIKTLYSDTFVDQHDFKIADLTGIVEIHEDLFTNCGNLEKIILDAATLKYCPNSAQRLVWGCDSFSTVELKNINGPARMSEALEEFCWNTDNFYGGVLNKRGYVKLTWEGKDDEF